MQGNPGTPSGTYGFALSNAELVLEIYSRCGIRPTEIQVQHTQDATRSLNLALQSWVNKGVNLFEIEQEVIQLIAGQASYSLPPEVVSVTDAYYNTIQSTGAGPDWDAPLYDPSQPVVSNDPQIVITASQDRWMRPMGRADYAMIPNKSLQGQPITYWVNRLGPPYRQVMTLWPVPSLGYPSAALSYFAVRQIQDANIPSGETPDVPTRFLDALCAEGAFRVARKYAPALIGTLGSGGLADDRVEAWVAATAEDTENAPIYFRPDFSGYWA